MHAPPRAQGGGSGDIPSDAAVRDQWTKGG